MQPVATARGSDTCAVRPVKKDEEVRVELDGEVVGRLPVTFQIVPRTLRVRSP